MVGGTEKGGCLEGREGAWYTKKRWREEFAVETIEEKACQVWLETTWAFWKTGKVSPFSAEGGVGGNTPLLKYQMRWKRPWWLAFILIVIEWTT